MWTRILAGMWMVIAAGGAVEGEPSAEARGFHKSLGTHNREEDYRALEDWVFEAGLEDGVRRRRADEAVWVLTEDDGDLRYNDAKEVWVEAFLERLERESGDFWWAWVAAGDLLRNVGSYGTLVDGKLVRGSVGPIYCRDRDRARLRQCYLKALQMVESPSDRAEVAIKLAGGIEPGQGAGFMKLTDLSVLPGLLDPRARSPWQWRPEEFLIDGRSPVIGSDGGWRLPVLRLQFDAAETDHERVYWLLSEAGRISPAHAARAKLALAEMWRELLGVHCLVSAGFVYIEGTGKDKGEFDLETLGDDETIVIGANGPERRTIPESSRYLTMFQELVEDAATPADVREEASYEWMEALADRYQFDAAEAVAKGVLERDPEHDDAEWFLEEIGPAGEFVECDPFAVGETVGVEFVSRELSGQHFELWKLDVEAYLANAGWQTLRTLGSGAGWAGEDDFEKQRTYYRRVASWESPVERRENHLQSVNRIEVPATEPGHYLVTANVKGSWQVLAIQVARTIALSAGLDSHAGDPDDDWVSGGDADLFLIDAISGKPVEGAVVAAVEGDQETVSDHTGYLLGMDGGGEIVVRRPGLEPEILQVEDGETSMLEGDEIRSFLVTNQPLYRPGQRVDYAGWLKRPNWRDTKSGRFDEDTEVRVTVVDPVGIVIHEAELALDEFGGFAGSFPLGTEMVLGNCYVTIAVSNHWSDDPFAPKAELKKRWVDLNSGWNQRWTFQVGEFRKPDFRVEVEAAGEDFAAVVRASYHSGDPVKGAPVKARLTAYPFRSQVFPKELWDDLYEPGYGWELPRAPWLKDWRKWGIWPEEEDWINDVYYGEEVVMEVAGVTDEQGRARLVFPNQLPAVGFVDYDCQVQVEVQEFTGRSVGAESGFVYTGRKHEVLVMAEKGFYREGETVKLEAWTLDTYREPLSGSGTVRVQAVAADGGLSEVLSKDVATDGAGRAVVEFVPPGPGQYRCAFQSGGGERGFVLEVIGDEPATGRYDGLQLIPSRAVGAAGDVVEVLIQTEEDEALVWFFEQMPDGRRRTPRLIDTKNRRAIVTIPLTKSGVPEFYLQSATVVKGRLKKATCRIVMPPVATRLEVGMAATPAKAAPGEPVEVGIAVKDAAEKPAVASLAVTAFDRALEDLGGPLPNAGRRLRERFEAGDWPESSQEPVERWGRVFRELSQPGCFFERGDLSGDPRRQATSRFEKVGTFLGIEYEPPELPNSVGGGLDSFAAFPKTPATPGGYSRMAGRGVELSAEEEAGMAAVGLRKNFADRAYWGAALRTDGDGKVRAHIDLPDNLTAWRVQAWAFGKDQAFGDGQIDIVVSKPLQVRPLLPQAAVEGDALTVGALVQNFSGEAHEFQVTMEADGVAASHDQVVTLAPGAEGKVEWQVTLEDAGSVGFRFRVRSVDGSLTDGAELSLPVARRSTPVTVAEKAEIAGGMKEARLDLALDVAMGATTLQVRVEASPEMSALMVLPDLVGYPYGCTEQTLNRFLPTLIAWKAAEKLGIGWDDMQRVVLKNDASLGWLKGRVETRARPADLSEEKVRGMIYVGLNRLGELQGSNGAWNWFSPQDSSGSASMTALAVRGIARARDLGFVLPNDPSARGISWLKTWAEARAKVLAGDPAGGEPLDAWVAFVLANVDEKGAPALSAALMKSTDELPAVALLHLALAVDEEKEPAEFQRLLALAHGKMADALAKSGEWWQDPVELRAWYLKALVKAGAGRAELEREIRGLLKMRRDGVRWSSTKDSALCVEAILEASIAAGGLDLQANESIEVTVEAAGLRRPVTLDRSNLWTAMLGFPVNADVGSGGVIPVVAGRPGDKAVTVAASISYDSSAPERLMAANDGIKVARNYYRVGGDGKRTLLTDGGKLRVGELVEVELTMAANEVLSYVHLRDPIPAGLEPLVQLSGYESGTYRESRTGETDLFISRMSEWNRVQRYHLRAVTTGKSLALPARAECMYAPEISGQSEARTINIE